MGLSHHPIIPSPPFHLAFTPLWGAIYRLRACFAPQYQHSDVVLLAKQERTDEKLTILCPPPLPPHLPHLPTAVNLVYLPLVTKKLGRRFIPDKVTR